MSEFRTVRYRASVFETRLTRWLRNLAVQFAPSTILSVRRLSFPPLSSLLLYIEAVMITLLVLQEPIRAFWYGTPLGGDRSLLAIYDSYIYTPGFLCSFFVKTAWGNDLFSKYLLLIFQFIVAFVFWLMCPELEAIESENLTVEQQAYLVWHRKIAMSAYWFFLIGGILNFVVLRYEQRTGVWTQSQEDGDEERVRRAHDRLVSLENMIRSRQNDEDGVVRRNWERRGAISEQGGLGPRRSAQEASLRERFAQVYPQAPWTQEAQHET